MIQEAPNRIMIDRTIVILAYRLTIVRNVDMVSMVKHGTIVERVKFHIALIFSPF